MGRSALGVETILSLPASPTSHAQPEPKRPTAALTKSSLNLSYEPKSRVIACASSPVGAPPPWGFMLCQKKVWFQIWAALLKTGPSPEPMMISSRLWFASALPSSRLFSLSTYALWCLP